MRLSFPTPTIGMKWARVENIGRMEADETGNTVLLFTTDNRLICHQEGQTIYTYYRKIDILHQVDEGKEWLNPSREKN